MNVNTPQSGSSPNNTIARLFDSDIWHSFKSSPVTVISAIMIVILVIGAVFAPILAPHNPYDLISIDIMDANLPPVWYEYDSDPRFLLGTDDQGRDVLSTIMYGSRVSLFVGFASVLFSIVLGVSLGLISGYLGGRLDAFIMRLADIQLSFPSILIAILVDGIARNSITERYP